MVNIDTVLLLKSLMLAFFSLFKMCTIFIIPIILIIIFLIIMIFINYINFRYVKHIKPKVSDVPKAKKVGFFKNLFILFPRQLAYDVLTQDPNAFGEFGIYMVVGEQGSGKTMTVVKLLQDWKCKYPKMQIYTNMSYKYEDGQLEHWKDLLEHNNGIYGIVNVIDEIKTWWSNKESKDLPPEILGEICQQRKQKKAIIGTVQVFSELAKPFRSQTHFVYEPHTFLGCLTIVFKTKAKWYNSEKDKFRKYCGFFIFAHTKKLREAYDTYKKIEKYKDQEFEYSRYFGVDQAPQVVEVVNPND